MPALRSIAATLLTVSCALGARAAEPVLAVLYVDNHSGDAAWDVLEKGLADMLVTDLAAQGLTVVERARLQALIEEQALQKTRFFDPQTAVKVGQGLGATHVVMGALAAMQPEIRLDLRMVDVATGKVVVTASVHGASSALFDLEQELVARFVAGFERRFAQSPTPQTKVRDVAALLEYSKALDLADRGELDAARNQIDQAVRLSPSFGLARKRKEELAQRIDASVGRREALIASQRARLAQSAHEALLARTGAADQAQQIQRLAWRDLEVQILAIEVDAQLSDHPFGVAALGKDKALRAALTKWADSARAFVSELDALLAGKPPSFWSARLPEADEKVAREVRFDTSVDTDPVSARLRLAEFLLLGELVLPDSQRATVAPPLANLDATWDERAWQALAEADAAARKAPNDYPAVRTLDLWAEALRFRGRSDEAIAKWQEVLDRYPTSGQFARIERRIKQVLGLEPDHTTRDLESWARGLASCDDMSFRVGIDTVVYLRFRMTGLQALTDTVAEVEKACRKNPAADRTWPYLYSWVARSYGKHGRCAEFEAWMAKALAAGESASDIAGWRTNWTKCPEPTTP